MRLYQNGVQVASGSANGNLVHKPGDATIGNDFVRQRQRLEGPDRRAGRLLPSGRARGDRRDLRRRPRRQAQPVGNFYQGIKDYLGTNDTIGGTAAGAGNVIGGNRNSAGLYIQSDGTDRAMNTLVIGNKIGTDPTGLLPEPNRYSGVGILDGADGVTVGGTAAGAGNVHLGQHLRRHLYRHVRRQSVSAGTGPHAGQPHRPGGRRQDDARQHQPGDLPDRSGHHDRRHDARGAKRHLRYQQLRWDRFRQFPGVEHPRRRQLRRHRLQRHPGPPERELGHQHVRRRNRQHDRRTDLHRRHGRGERDLGQR